MTREVLSRSTTSLKPQQFDTLQRRSEYSDALNAKRGARQLRATIEAESIVMVSPIVRCLLLNNCCLHRGGGH